MSAIDTLLSRLDSPRQNGTDRWRSACPVCGARNRSTLSIGVGDNGAVLLKCWKSGCGPEAIAHALGLDVADLFPDRGEPGHGAGPLKRRRLLTAQQALDLLHDEAHVLWIVACDMRSGRQINEADMGRLTVAVSRIGTLRAEVHA